MGADEAAVDDVGGTYTILCIVGLGTAGGSLITSRAVVGSMHTTAGVDVVWS